MSLIDVLPIDGKRVLIRVDFNVPLQAGEIVLSGSLAGAPFIAAGDNFIAEFDRLGTVSVVFK